MDLCMNDGVHSRWAFLKQKYLLNEWTNVLPSGPQSPGTREGCRQVGKPVEFRIKWYLLPWTLGPIPRSPGHSYPNLSLGCYALPLSPLGHTTHFLGTWLWLGLWSDWSWMGKWLHQGPWDTRRLFWYCENRNPCPFSSWSESWPASGVRMMPPWRRADLRDRWILMLLFEPLDPAIPEANPLTISVQELINSHF